MKKRRNEKGLCRLDSWLDTKRFEDEEEDVLHVGGSSTVEGTNEDEEEAFAASRSSGLVNSR